MSEASPPTARVFEAPGPGQWVLDTGHFPRPATPFTAELFPQPSKDGFADATAPYGLLLDFIEWAFVDGWGYMSPFPVAPLRDSSGLTRQEWDDLVASSPELAARLATSGRVFEDRLWRHDLALWDDSLKPSLIASHHALQAADPEDLDDAALLAHLHECRENLRVAIRTHHRFNVTPVLPVGELLVQSRDWAGATAVDVLGLLQGAGPLAVGATDELARMVTAISGDPASRAVLESLDESAGVLGSLCSQPGPPGQAASSYVGLIGHWSAGSGFDIDEPSLLEMPDLLVESIRVAVTNGSQGEGSQGDGSQGGKSHPGSDAGDRAADLRRAVAPALRLDFDDLLAEARTVHRLRDERALYCDVWANGLMRRAILAAGTRLTRRGTLEVPDHLVEATYAEMGALLMGEPAPAATDLAARAQRRQVADPAAVPVTLGRSTRSPVPAAWLGPGAARTETAFRTYLAAMAEGDEPAGESAATVRGVAGSPGVYEGRARVVHGASGIGDIRDGDVLVADATSPAFNIVLPLLGAIVTDRGGMLSHAAIVAREYGIPAVVGCDDATRRISDGARVRVDGSSGEATVVS